MRAGNPGRAADERAAPSPAGTAATGATPHDRHAGAMMKQGLGAALVPPRHTAAVPNAHGGNDSYKP